MKSESKGSVSCWIDDLRDGHSLAAQEIWNRYFDQLVQLASARLGGLNRVASGEDIALSALNSVMVGVQAGKFPELVDRDSLWPLLVTITARKSITQMRRQLAQKRGANTDVRLKDVEQFLGVDPTPEFAVEVIDLLEHLISKYEDPNLRLIVQRKLEGQSHQEIAHELSCSTRTVIRKLNLVRQEWEEDGLCD